MSWCNRKKHGQAFECIGDLISGHHKNLEALASKSLGDEPETEPALNSILRIILRTSSMQEFIAADYVFKNFCEVLFSSFFFIKQNILTIIIIIK